ncbi:hypothetical protein HPB50_018613 [Hyalomma asiaticum]|uniref:Uncharacterized protein n=1 Tax=Hyalomma asiaticum TaxID=266040 RepID=A0ACB7SJD9_HYAAI|nr:hypothetical protein HPB50_018613 [Hyalomma asiaticum]
MWTRLHGSRHRCKFNRSMPVSASLHYRIITGKSLGVFGYQIYPAFYRPSTTTFPRRRAARRSLPQLQAYRYHQWSMAKKSLPKPPPQDVAGSQHIVVVTQTKHRPPQRRRNMSGNRAPHLLPAAYTKSTPTRAAQPRGQATPGSSRAPDACKPTWVGKVTGKGETRALARSNATATLVNLLLPQTQHAARKSAQAPR